MKSTTTSTGGTQTLNVSGNGRYVRMYGTARATPYGYSLWEFSVFTTGGGGGGNAVTATNPGSQASTVGSAASVQISATDSASGQTLTYSATGLPAGLSISTATGLISGSPTAAGSSTVTVTARDGTGASLKYYPLAMALGRPRAAFVSALGGAFALLTVLAFLPLGGVVDYLRRLCGHSEPEPAAAAVLSKAAAPGHTTDTRSAAPSSPSPCW